MIRLFVVLVMFIAMNASGQWQSDYRLTYDPIGGYTYGYGNAWSIGTSGNNLHVVWHDFRNGNWDIYYKRSTDGGINWGADIQLTNDPAQSDNASIAVSVSNLHVVWHDNRNGNWDIYYKRSTDGGSTWEADTRLTNDPAISYTSSVTVSGSNVHVVWKDTRDGNEEIYYKRSTNGGLSWDADMRLTNNSYSSSLSSITVSGSVVNVVWQDNRDENWEIYYKRSTDGGAMWDTDTRLTSNSASSTNPSIAVSGSIIHVVWYDTRDGNEEIYYKRSTNGGLSWDADMRLTNNSYSSSIPNIAVSGTVVHVVWQENIDGNDEIFYKRSTNGGTNWEADTRLTNNGARSILPSISVVGSRVNVVWTDTRNGGIIHPDIYYKLDPTGNPAIDNYVFITSPNGGEKYISGSSQNITWNSSGIQNVKIELTTNDGISWSTIISSYSAVSGSYTWTLPNYFLTNCKIRISDVLNSGTNDISDNPFEILPINYVFPSSGAVNNIVIFIRFASGWQFSEPISFYEQLYNDQTVNSNSLYNYYKEVSYDKLYIQSLFYPIQVGNNVVAYQDNNERGYYKPFNILTNPSGYVNQEERNEREELLCVSAINAVKDLISPPLEIDANDDGYVDGITFIAEGDRAGIFGNVDYIFWPHSSYFTLYHPSINGKDVIRYNFHIQNNLKDSEYGVGVLAHELFHLMGVHPHAPDLYRFNGSNQNPVWEWDLMDQTTNPPVHMGAFMKHEWGGWIDNPIREITNSGYYSLAPLSNGANNYYKIQSNDPSGNEFYYLEYRKKNTIFENSLPGEGLLVYRINKSIYGNNYNEPSNPYNVYIYRKDGTITNIGYPEDAAYSSNSGRTAINNTTNPSPFLSDGTDGGLKIDNIGSIGDNITFRVIISKPPTVQFSASNQNIHPGQSVSFFDSSTNYPTSWDWSFPGGSPSSSNEQNPTNIVYNNIGSYEVSLTASNEYGTTQLSKYTYINVTPMTPTYNSVLKNGVLTSANTYEFDIYLMRTGIDIFELSGFQVAISFNPAIKNGGTISFAKIGGTYGFNYFTPDIPSADNTNNILKVTSKAPPGPGNGDIVPTSPGLRYGRFRISTSASSFGASAADLAWYFNAGIYPTVVTAYDQTTSAIIDITVPASNTSDLNNVPLPVEFASFTANINIRDVSLTWRTVKETNNKGFDIERKKTDEEWSKIGYIDGKGTMNMETSYKYDDKKLNTGKYNYRLKQIDYNGNFGYYTLNTVIEIVVPTKFDISQNYPNPFNPNTKIDYQLPEDASVSILIYDITGREINKLLSNEKRTAGYYTLDFYGSNFASGIYFYRFIAASNGKQTIMTKKMVILK